MALRIQMARRPSHHFAIFFGTNFGLNLTATQSVGGTDVDIKDNIDFIDYGLMVGAGFEAGRVIGSVRYTHGIRDIEKTSTDKLTTRTITAMIGNSPFGRMGRQSSDWPTRAGLGTGASVGVVLLQRLHGEAFGAERGDGADGGGGAGERRDGRHALQHRDAAHGAVVEERLAAERRVDDERDAAVEQLVADVRPAFVDLEDDARRRGRARAGTRPCRASRRA